MVENIHDLLRTIGVANIAQLNNPRIQPYIYNLNFDVTIAAAGFGNAQVKTDSGWAFVVQQLASTVFIPQASGAAIAGSMAAPDGSVTLASNTFMSLGHFTLTLRTSTVQWMSSPTRLSNLCGNARLPGYWLREPIVGPGDTVQGILDNLSAEAVRAQISLQGYRIAL